MLNITGQTVSVHRVKTKGSIAIDPSVGSGCFIAVGFFPAFEVFLVVQLQVTGRATVTLSFN